MMDLSISITYNYRMDDQAFKLLSDQLKRIEENIKALDTEVKGLNAFRWKMYGAYMLFVFIVAAIK